MKNTPITRRGKIVIALITLAVASALIGIYMDYLWFKSVEYASAYLTMLYNRIGMHILVFVVCFLLFIINLLITRKNASPDDNRPDNNESGREIIYLHEEKSPWKKFIKSPTAKWSIILISLLGALIISSASGENWIVVQQFFHRVPFGNVDPIFHKDISFYVFNLSFYKFIYRTLMSTLIMITVVIAFIYALDITSEFFFAEWKRFTAGKSHVAILLAAIIGLKAWGYKLAAYGLLESTSGIVYGATYSDVHARLVAYRVLLVVAIAVAAIILLNIFIKKISWIVYSIAAWIILSVILTGVYPVIMQKFLVQPNEFQKEKPYLQNAIAYTRKAYALNQVDKQQFKIKYDLTMDDINNKTTIDNIRLWDWQPLTDTYRSLQELRLYYVFNDVDIDRYIIDGQYRQVMLSARELDQSNLPAQAQTWINQRLMYTHGYGLAMSPVNEIAQEGFPKMFIKDIPPVFGTDLKVTRPEIYFGEKTDSYVIVNTNQKEFNYPAGDKNVYSTYQGTKGIKINSFGRRLLFAWILKDYKLLLSTEVTNNSQVLMNRNVVERINKVAPYLGYDSDPYIVINNDGKLYWILDAYTYTDKYPYSEPFDKEGRNYIRNSVKVVCDSYTGEMNFYVSDPSDPVITTYQKIFPRVYKPLSEMPEGLKSHLRYPVDLFSVQAELYRTFHMQDPWVFYNKEDSWVIPSEIVEGKEQKVEPYYIIMRLPGEEKAEYILMLPYTPNNRPNMIAWMCARMDGKDYGKILVYSFPKQETVYGPMQIESRISQDTEISRQLSLWDQKGSQTYRGNLIIIPIDNSILYIEPLYLQAESSKMPELKRVIAAFNNEVVMETSLDEALIKIFGQSSPGTASTTDVTSATGDVSSTNIKELAQQARQYYDQANQLLKEGDWAGYGDNINKLNDTIKRMEEITGK